MPNVALAAATFRPTQNLSFGTLIPTTTSGTVTIGTAGNISTGSVVTVAPSGTGYYEGKGKFTGTGLSSVTDAISIAFLNSSVTLTNETGGTVTVNNFSSSPNVSINSLNPSTIVSIGAKMTFNSLSTSGTYNGSVQVRATSALAGDATMTLPIMLTLWRPLAVTQVQKLSFGGLEVGGNGTSVVAIDAATGQRTIVSGTSVHLASSMPGANGQFNITGNPNTVVHVNLPANISLAGPGTAMTVNSFAFSPSTTTLDSNGKMTLRVGARLRVPANQAAGTYTGFYNLTVSY